MVYNDSVSYVATETWLRSIPYGDDASACIIGVTTESPDGLVYEYATATYAGVSPCFTLK